MKVCSKCKISKDETAFGKNAVRADGLQHYCKQCQAEHNAKPEVVARRAARSKVNYAKDRQTWIERRWATTLVSEYGITADDYNRMFAEQNGCCAICGKPETMIDHRYGKLRRLAVDHDHKTGKVRGLLCYLHNQMVGLASDDPSILIAGSQYLNGD